MNQSTIFSSTLMMLILFTINCKASPDLYEVSQLGQSIVNQIEESGETTFSMDINNPDLYENAYLPIDIQVRQNGIGFEQSDIKVRRAIHELISQVFSPKGYLRFITNLELSDELSIQTSKNTNHVFSFYGKPSSGNWGFKFEGYHISITFLIRDNQLKFINYFQGQDIKLLKKSEFNPDSIYNSEVESGMELVNSLTPNQLEKTYLSINTPLDIMTNPKQSFLVTEQLGLPSKSIKRKQIPIFESWINGYLNQFSETVVSTVFADLEKQDYENFHIIWSGDFNTAQADLYYLVYTDKIIIEHSFKENHLHTITRMNF